MRTAQFLWDILRQDFRLPEVNAAVQLLREQSPERKSYTHYSSPVTFHTLMFAQVIILEYVYTEDEPRAFTYDIPIDLHNRLAPGHLVIVPFANRRLPGLVTALIETTPIKNLKPIEALLDPVPALSPTQFELAKWISTSTFAPLHECLELFLPPGIQGRVDTLYTLVDAEIPAKLSATQAELVSLLKSRGPLRSTQIDRALPRKNWQEAARSLMRRKLIEKRSILLPPSARPKLAKYVRLIAPIGRSAAKMQTRSDLSAKPDVAERRSRVLDFLARENKPVWISGVYAETGANLADLHALADRELIALTEEEVWRDPLAEKTFVAVDPPQLTNDQSTVWNEIQQNLSLSPAPAKRPRSEAEMGCPLLLYGITGSGKTEIYLRAVAETLAQNKRAIVLVPEIALTPQTVRRFAARFVGRVGVIHSGLSEGERYDVWRKARSGAIDVLIGPRSAIFAPIDRLGLIVIDEEHEHTYKQDNRPFYHAREVAVQLAKLSNATLILGSATPALESWSRAQRGEFKLLTLPRRVIGHTQAIQDQQTRFHIEATSFEPSEVDDARYAQMPPVDIVDLRAEIKSGNPHIFSRRLQSALTDVLQRHEQAILFINRRGAATFVLCRDCGHVLKCPRCDSPLTYHEPLGQPQGIAPTLICHTCNHREAQPNKCPNCQSTRIRYFGSGTQKVESTLKELLPQARTLRWDADTSSGKDAHEIILQHFINHEADVLIGTQMIAKGLDLPLVTLVGVISADTNLNLPDFRSSERAFQLLAQVVGRAGRSLLGGRAIIQTYAPDHYAIEAAAEHDYEAFAKKELEFRQQMDYPPFTRLARLLIRDASTDRAKQAAEKVAAQLTAMLASRGLARDSIIGPAPCFFAKLRDQYRWQIALRHPDPVSIVRELRLSPAWRVDIDPLSLL
jgi:primosomal protein N' (replication factor Y)